MEIEGDTQEDLYRLSGSMREELLRMRSNAKSENWPRATHE